MSNSRSTAGRARSGRVCDHVRAAPGWRSRGREGAAASHWGARGAARPPPRPAQPRV